MAIFVHCLAHSINVCLQDCSQKCKAERDDLSIATEFDNLKTCWSMFFLFLLLFLFLQLICHPSMLNYLINSKKSWLLNFLCWNHSVQPSLFVGLFLSSLWHSCVTINTSRVVIIIGLYWTVGPGRQPPELYPVNLRRP